MVPPWPFSASEPVIVLHGLSAAAAGESAAAVAAAAETTILFVPTSYLVLMSPCCSR